MNVNTPFLLAIDPGSEESGYVFMETSTLKPTHYGKISNQELRQYLYDLVAAFPIKDKSEITLCVEYPFPRGQIASWQLFDTIAWVGRFEEVLIQQSIILHRVDRKDVKMHLCNIVNASDTAIKYALIAKYGDRSNDGPKCPECDGRGGTGTGRDRVYCARCNGTKEIEPGVLFGLKKDMWQALGLGVTFIQHAAYPKSSPHEF